MFGGRHNGWRAGWFSLAVVITAIAPSSADAAWLGYKNDTTAVVVIQAADVVVVNGKVQQLRPGKQHPLYPGEVARDAIAAPGPRIVTVYDPKQNMKVVFQERVDLNGKDDVILSLRLITPPVVRGQPPQPPQLRLIPIVVPPAPRLPLPPGANRGTPPIGSPPPGQPPANPTPPAMPPATKGPPSRGGR